MPRIPIKKMRMGRKWNRLPVQISLLGVMRGERAIPPMEGDMEVSPRGEMDRMRKRKRRASVYDIDVGGRRPPRFGRTETREGIA